MKQKFAYVATPAILSCPVSTSEIEKIQKRGVPLKRQDIKVNSLFQSRYVVAVKNDDTEGLARLVTMQGIEDPVILDIIVPSYYKCVGEIPETQDEMELCKEFGPPHLNMCYVQDKVKPKYIQNIKNME